MNREEVEIGGFHVQIGFFNLLNSIYFFHSDLIQRKKRLSLCEMFVYVLVWNVWGWGWERERGVYYVRKKGEGSWVRVNVNVNKKWAKWEAAWTRYYLFSPTLFLYLYFLYSFIFYLKYYFFLFLSLPILWVLIVLHVLIKQPFFFFEKNNFYFPFFILLNVEKYRFVNF